MNNDQDITESEKNEYENDRVETKNKQRALGGKERVWKRSGRCQLWAGINQQKQTHQARVIWRTLTFPYNIRNNRNLTNRQDGTSNENNEYEIDPSDSSYKLWQTNRTGVSIDHTTTNNKDNEHWADRVMRLSRILTRCSHILNMRDQSIVQTI